ncbi:MAG: TolC family protein [Muribaculaceae bacterium]|nr:TolC family protein [Muribaculaceae bacterium]
MKKTMITCVATAIMATTALEAQTKWSLDSCINYAIEHNLTVAARQLDRLSGDYDITEARDRFLPNLNASASQSFNFGRGLTSENTYADRNTKNFQWGVSLDLPLFQGLSATRQLKQAKINLRSLVLQVESAKDDITLNVISQYLQVLAYSEMLKTSEQQVALSAYQLERQQALADAGKIAEVDVVQARSQLATDRQSVADNQNNLTIALLDLAQLLNLPSPDGFELMPLDSTEPVIRPADEVYRSAMVSNHSILSARNDIEVAEAAVNVARSGYLPRLSFNAGIGSSYYNISGIENPSFSRQMRDNLNKYLGFSLSIPIFDAFSTRNSVRKAKVRGLNAALQLRDRETALYKEIQQAYYRATGARQKYQTGLETEAAAREAFEAMKGKYEMGRSNPTEFEQAKTQYEQAVINRIQSHYEYILRSRILDFYASSNRLTAQ